MSISMRLLPTIPISITNKLSEVIPVHYIDSLCEGRLTVTNHGIRMILIYESIPYEISPFVNEPPIERERLYANESVDHGTSPAIDVTESIQNLYNLQYLWLTKIQFRLLYVHLKIHLYMIVIYGV